MNMKILGASLVVIFTLIGCNRVKETIPDYTYDIYPVATGASQIYEVIDTTFSTQGAEVDKYFRQEQFGNTETDLGGREVYRLETFRSEYDLGDDYQFEPDRVWSVYVDDESVERWQENNRYWILKFPVYTNIRWNGHLYNGLGEQIYRYQSIDTVLTFRGKTYDPAVVVMHSLPSDTTSFVRYRLAYEAYAPGIGKIFQYDKTIVNDGPNGEFNPDESYVHIEMLVE